MNPDIVYIYAEGCSKWRGQELKYSLRSLERHGKNYGKVYLIGDKPKYLNDKIIHIQQTDNSLHSKERKICEKIITACQTKELSETFLIFNDDYFLVKEIDLSNIPYYYSDIIENKISRRQKLDVYKKSLKNTLEALKVRRLETFHFDIHYPMFYEKEKFKRVMAIYDWTVRQGYVIKSLYANTLQIKGKEKKDAKIYKSFSKKEIRKIIEETDLFSTDEITRAMAEMFQELYPEKSTFEN